MKGHRLQVLVFSLIILACFLLLPVAYNLSPVFTPASPLYFLKSVREILELRSADNLDIKARLQLQFANRRIREMRSLIGTSHEDLIEPALTRYAAHLQEFTNIANFSDKGLKTKIAEITTEHMKILQVIYGTVSEQRAKRSIRVAVHKLSQWDNILMNKIDPIYDSWFTEQITLSKLSGCDFLSGEASSSAITETERWVLSQRA
ncbi:MAG: DUF5667 domain-containing protein, partial [Candidatus Daviesbacteria bacterium]|nr:DUF5667 domain-containing protein [Candidatus Daviesbacteria bacterium]